MTPEEAAKILAERVQAAGGRSYYVGGYVRDRALGRNSDDLDIEVYGLLPETLLKILESIGTVKTVGVSFGIYLLQDYGIDVAMPRKESCTGAGHRDFTVYVDPFLSPKAAAARRDFTVNAMMEDVLTGEISDFYGGLQDIEAGILRHVNDEHFGEDPLRVFRGCRFAARLGYSIAPETVSLCSKMDLSRLAGERVEEELKKALCQGEKPSLFFRNLRDMNALAVWFPEIQALVGVRQDPIHHPEGDVWTHTMEVLDRCALLRHKSKNPYCFMLLALTHDLGKVSTFSEKDGRIHAYGHETAGVLPALTLWHRISGNKEIGRYLENMIPLHMKPNMYLADGASEKAFCRLFDEAAAPEDLILFSAADAGPGEKTDTNQVLLQQALGNFRSRMEKPCVSGRDLIAAGIAPGEEFSRLLAYAHKLRLAGVDKESALRQTLAMANKTRRKKP